MAAGRLRFAVSCVLTLSWSLLAAMVFPGCNWHREYTRRGAVLDSLASRTDRVEREQLRGAQELDGLRAEILTELEGIVEKLGQLEARSIDQEERLARIGRRLGVWRSNLTAPDSVPTNVTDTVPVDTVPVDTTPAVTDTGAAAVDPDQLYATAYLDFTRGKYRVAIAGFHQYLQMFPGSDLADNAQYWIGECHHSLGELIQAEQEFKRVMTDHPDGNKVPAAEYKLGLVYLAQNRPEDARRQFEAVVGKYPGTTEARLAQDRLSGQ